MINDKLLKIIKENETVLSKVNEEQINCLVDMISKSKRLFLDGRGRSGLMMAAFAMRLTHLGIECHVVGEFTTPSLREDDLLIIGSGSGATITPLAAAKLAKKVGGSVAAITSRAESELANIADVAVIIQAPVRGDSGENCGNVRSIQPMASLFEQSLLLLVDAIVIILKEKLGTDDDAMRALHSNLE